MAKQDKYITMKFTPKEFEAVVDGIDSLSAMKGGDLDEDHYKEVKDCIRGFDRALKRSGLPKRNFS